MRLKDRIRECMCKMDVSLELENVVELYTKVEVLQETSV